MTAAAQTRLTFCEFFFSPPRQHECHKSVLAILLYRFGNLAPLLHNTAEINIIICKSLLGRLYYITYTNIILYDTNGIPAGNRHAAAGRK